MNLRRRDMTYEEALKQEEDVQYNHLVKMAQEEEWDATEAFIDFLQEVKKGEQEEIGIELLSLIRAEYKFIEPLMWSNVIDSALRWKAKQLAKEQLKITWPKSDLDNCKLD